MPEIQPQSEAAASPPSDTTAKPVDETGVEAEEDDINFIPVVSQHIRKENKRRAAAPVVKPRSGANAGPVGKLGNGEKPVRRGDRPERKERRVAVEKDAKVVDKDVGAAKAEAGGSSDQSSSKSSNEDEKEDSVKFVEAPIPVVNAWKLEKEVSPFINIFETFESIKFIFISINRGNVYSISIEAIKVNTQTTA